MSCARTATASCARTSLNCAGRNVGLTNSFDGGTGRQKRGGRRTWRLTDGAVESFEVAEESLTDEVAEESFTDEVAEDGLVEEDKVNVTSGV